jgi:hypothetical protein
MGVSAGANEIQQASHPACAPVASPGMTEAVQVDLITIGPK